MWHDPEHPSPPAPDQVDPEVLTALLVRHGWQRRGGVHGRYTRWTPPGAAPRGGPGAGTSLLVPAPGGYGDYCDLLGEALTALARSGAPSARDVLLALAVPGDEIRWRRAAGGTGAAVPWDEAERLRTAAADTLLAAARATRSRAGYFGERHRRYADAYLRQVLVGPSPSGQALTAYAPAPDGRAVTVTLLRALRAVRDAVDHQRATGRLDAFDAAVELGVCHELVTAIALLVHGSEGAELQLDWSPVAGVPVGLAARPAPVGFTPGDLPALHLAAARYLAAEPALPATVTGTVTRLRSDRPEDGGTVRLRVLAGAPVARIRAGLDRHAYRVAVHAHLVGLPLRLTGRLESRGGFRTLAAVTAVAPVPVDAAERERMLKALDDGEPGQDGYGPTG
ncbi:MULTISPECIES: hypothetical protein [Streptomycetaceae]|uniref:Uncharacterized protein n=1 Tax=Streptantibioticus cattleyicolor (strain ATCC 35852 / DSM 46488 / JCM 4925 / NBRC 14057 / NRRL 8057) TaxID=1003195 RepID=F8K3V9_STREN|nr:MULTISPECIES: hypothetical protein [Streptomycetaceae]AEW97659.1 hypothetical protein SCATT_52880 [Streptantibioticus cattleyicolor NRRL 8057 = DSM 46488]MYS62085.1 hypothetical protein [Streptomyces sp. SID5468]CCB77979.1 conserved protein of unknown function [Streptantibioticus cattleyicolor NRRL 8057 = DSM 46488]